MLKYVICLYKYEGLNLRELSFLMLCTGCGQISETNEKVSLPLSQSVIFETPFRHIKKISYLNDNATRVLQPHASLQR